MRCIERKTDFRNAGVANRDDRFPDSPGFTIVANINLSANSVESNCDESVAIARWSWRLVTVVETAVGLVAMARSVLAVASGRDGNGSGGPSE